jgi:NTP pyrophosphatase (non-canonical NTP hydrolase)
MGVKIITLNAYQDAAAQTANFGDKGIIYPALGLAGEAGEAVDKIKKLWRNKDIKYGEQYSDEERTELVKELGDVLWYLSAIALELEVSLQEVAEVNIDKLLDRKERNVLKSEGDNR